MCLRVSVYYIHVCIHVHVCVCVYVHVRVCLCNRARLILMGCPHLVLGGNVHHAINGFTRVIFLKPFFVWQLHVHVHNPHPPFIKLVLVVHTYTTHIQPDISFYKNLI